MQVLNDPKSPRRPEDPGLLRDSRAVHVDAPPDKAFEPIRRIGGDRGWYAYNWLWTLRRGIDLLMGGVGFRRGRRDPENLEVGDTVDCWRVEAFEPDRRLRLALEMRIPGRGWLEFEVSRNAHGSIIRQTALFEPAGMAGRAYWHLSSPLHHLVFGNMIQGIAGRAETAARSNERDPS